MEHYKAHLVVPSNTQKEGIYYTETFTLVAKMVMVCTLLSVAFARNWDVHQMDVDNAFSHRDLTEEVYICLPSDFRSSGSA